MYGGMASSISAKNSSLGDIITNINGLNFKGVWNSTAGKKLLVSLTDAVSKVNTEKGNLSTFVDALNKLDELIAKDNRIAELSSQLAGLDPDDEDDAGAIAAINAEISRLQEERRILKEAIVGILGSFGAIGTDAQLVVYTNTSDFDYICDIEQLESMLKKCYVYPGNVANLYKETQSNGLSGMDYVNSQLDSVLESYSGREAAVNSVLMSLMLAADKGVKYKYTNSGANGANGIKYNTNEQMIDGMDCCAYVSWAVNKGTPQPFHWEGVGALNYFGDTVDISQALPGDILVNNKHVAIIIANEPETGQVTIAEAGGRSSDVHMVTYDYDKIRGSFSSGTYPKVQSLENYYTGVKNNVNGSGSVRFDTWKEKVEYY